MRNCLLKRQSYRHDLDRPLPMPDLPRAQPYAVESASLYGCPWMLPTPQGYEVISSIVIASLKLAVTALMAKIGECLESHTRRGVRRQCLIEGKDYGAIHLDSGLPAIGFLRGQSLFHIELSVVLTD